MFLFCLLESKLNKVIKYNELVEELELFVTISSDKIYVSQNGIDWNGISDTRRHNDIFLGNDNIYAVGSEDHEGSWKLKISSSTCSKCKFFSAGIYSLIAKRY